MRTIKFRVWDNVDYMSGPFTLMDLQEKKIGFTSDCVIMQFTGLQDKNGVDIYEGDVVIMDKDFGKELNYIVYSGCSFSTECSITKDLGDIYSFTDKMKVIGNIHQSEQLKANDTFHKPDKSVSDYVAKHGKDLTSL